MKKSLLALAVAALPAVVSAQTVIGGSLNVGLLDTGANNSKARVSSLGGGANAINITSSEKIGKDLTAGVRFQLRFKSNTGDTGSGTGSAATSYAADNGNGTLFHDANAFISSASLGEIRLGKIFEDSNCGLDPWGCATTGGAGLSVPGGSQVRTLTAAQSQAESIRYASPRFMGFGLTYQTTINGGAPSFPRDAQRQVINLNYAQGPLMAQVLITKGGIALGSGSAADGQDMSVGASYDFKVAKAMFNYVERENAAGTTTNKITAVGAAVPFAGKYHLLAGYARDSKITAGDDSTWSLGVNYMLSKRTTLGADLYQAAHATGGSTGTVLRVRHTF